MRRFLLFVFTFFSFSVFSQSKDFSRWSFTPEFGCNYFNGDVNQDLHKLLPTSARNFTYGASVECALTPVWGLALDGYYFPLRAENPTFADLLINTNLYNTDLNVTINFTRLLFPHTRSKFYISGSVGLGFAYYEFDNRYSDGTSVGTSDFYVDQKYNGATRPVLLYKNNSPLDYSLAASCPVTFSAEYNLSKPLSLGVKMHYRAYTKDSLEGITYLNGDGVSNDVVAAGTLFLRYKFCSRQKEHLRNITSDVYDPDKGLLLAREVDAKLNKLKNRVDTIGAKVDSLMPRVARLENLLSNDGPDSDGDGVPDVRDKDMNTAPNTAVDFWGKPLPINPYYGEGGHNGAGTVKGRAIYVPDEVPSVYFDFDQIDLDDAALITISKIASKMKADPTLYVEVRGYCDYSGSNPYNNLLSQRRSDRVKAELVKVWGIPFDHVISNGKGKVIEPRVKYRPNRRCDFFFGRL